MKVSADARLTADTAQSVCVRTASAAVLEGSIAALVFMSAGLADVRACDLDDPNWHIRGRTRSAEASRSILVSASRTWRAARV